MQRQPEENSGPAQATTLGLARLRALVTSLRADWFPRVRDSGWTVAATLAHLAFWIGRIESVWVQGRRLIQPRHDLRRLRAGSSARLPGSNQCHHGTHGNHYDGGNISK
jgi:hypothetical protein